MSLPRAWRRSARMRPAPAPRQTRPAALIRRPVVGWASARARKPLISAAAVGRLGPLAGQRRISRIQLRHRPAGDEPLVRAQRAARQPATAPARSGRTARSPTGGTRPRARGPGPARARSQRASRPPTAGSFARSRPPGAAAGTTCRANAAACGDSDDGRHRAIYPATAGSSAGMRPPRHHLSTGLYCGQQPRPVDLRRCVAWNQPQPSARPWTRSPPRLAAAAGLALPGTLAVRAYACGKPELPVPRRPAPAARPIRRMDPQDRRQDRDPAAHRRRARRIPAADSTTPRNSAPCSPGSRTSPSRSSRQAAPSSRKARRTGAARSGKRGPSPLNLWAALQPDPVCPGQP